MLIAGVSLLVLLIALWLSLRSDELPMDRDVILRIRHVAEQRHREQLLPFD
jgi:hypothetical protein